MPVTRMVMRASILGAIISTTVTGCNSSSSVVDQPSGPGVIVFLAQPSTEDFIPQLFAIQEDGTGLRQLTDDKVLRTAMAWSPDGSQVAYAAMEFEPEGAGDEDKFTSIFTIALDGSSERRLCTECSRTLYSQVPGPGVVVDLAGAADYEVPDSLAWSPDGTRLVAPATSNGLLVVDVADGTTSVIETDEPVTAVAWSPDGKTVAASHTWFLSANSALGEMAPASGTWWYESGERPERPGGIYLIDVDDGSVEEVVSEPGLAHTHGWIGDLLAYARVAGGGKHAEVAAYSIEERRSWTVVPAERGSADQGAGLSPNGDRLAALIEQFDEEHDPVLWTASASGEDLTSRGACTYRGAFPGQCYVPGIAWSPDGDEIVYRAFISHTPLIHVLVVHAVGSGDKRIIELPELFPASSSYCCIAWHSTAQG